MKKSFLSLLVLGVVLSFGSAASADMGQAAKQKEKSRQQKEAFEQKQQKQKVDSKAMADKQKEMAQKQKENEMKSNISKGQHDTQKAVINNMR